MTTIKEQTIEAIEVVLKQHKRFYRSNEFGFPTHNGNYSTHQGAVLRYYLKEHGYVNVRVSDLDKSFFLGIDYGLKPSNTIILKVIDFERYVVGQKRKFFNFNTKEKVLLAPMDIKVGLINNGRFGSFGIVGHAPNKPKLNDFGRESAITLLVDKYTSRLKAIKQFYALNIDDLPLQECTDLEAHIKDLQEIITDLKSLL